MSDSVRPHRQQPTRLPRPWDSPGKSTGVGCHFSNAWKWKVKVKSLSRVRLVVMPWTAAYQAPPSMGFSRQEYWSGLTSPGWHSSPRCLQAPDFSLFLKISGTTVMIQSPVNPLLPFTPTTFNVYLCQASCYISAFASVLSVLRD